MRRLLPLALLWPGLALAQPPELPLPDGAVRTAGIQREADAYALPTGPARDGPPPAMQLQGDVRIEAWRIADAPDPARILAPIRAALERAGFEILLDCAAEGCGGFDFRYGTEVLPPPEMHVDLGAFRALSARRDEPEGAVAVSALASRAGPSAFLQLATVTPGGEAMPVTAPAATRPDIPAPDGLAGALMRDGHVVLDGIDFAPGSAELRVAEIPALDALAAWLAADPSRRLVLVGHTDMTGPLDANIALSRRRAEAVRRRLTEAGIAPARLEAHGAGWLAPRAPNATAEGRAANRRVEAVVPGG